MVRFSLDPAHRLTRKDTAKHLTDAGFPISQSTLATKATRGGGPPFVRFNGRVLYTWGDALAWANKHTSAPVLNTAQAKNAEFKRPNPEMGQANG